MAYLRTQKQGKYTYLLICEGQRDAHQKVQQKILYRLGRLEDYSAESLETIAVKLYELSGGNRVDLLRQKLYEKARYNYGFPVIVKRLFEVYDLKSLLNRFERKHHLSFSLLDSLLLLVCDRLQDPMSKLASHDFQDEYVGLQRVKLSSLYKTMEILGKYSEAVQQHLFRQNQGLFKHSLEVVFFDVTTFYFDSQKVKEGSIRQKGYSKDGKIGKTQVVFALLIDKYKNPIAYRTYEGNKYEGHTLSDAIKTLKNQYPIGKVTVVADRGMMNKANLELFNPKQVGADFQYIIGERLKKLPKKVQAYLCNIKNYQPQKIQDKEGETITMLCATYTYKGRLLISTYSTKRAAKDKKERIKRIEKAKKLLQKPSQIEPKAKRYFIKNKQKNKYQLDEQKIKEHEKFDGFAVIATNAKKEQVNITLFLDHYKHLFQIEQVFRTCKSHLELRPMYHWTDLPIKGHICMCFIAFVLLNYLQNTLKKAELPHTEKQLRKQMKQMQVSLIQNGSTPFYLRSNMDEHTKKLLKQLKIKALKDVTPKHLIDKYL